MATTTTTDDGPAPLDRDAVLALLRGATAAHKAGRLEDAVKQYRRAIAAHPDQQACVLLAALLVSAPAPPADAAARRAEAFALAARAEAGADAVVDAGRRALLLTRCGHFYIAAAARRPVGDGGDADDEAEDGVDTAALGAARRAIVLLERAAALDAAAALTWRNLAVAYRAAGRHDDAERAAGRAVAAAGARASADLLYRHAKALQRLGRGADAAARFCDTLAREPAHELAAFWLRVGASAAASGAAPPLPPALRERVTGALAAAAAHCRPAGGGVSGGAPAPAVPHAYVARLFDGYAAKFDAHLVGLLGYRTPGALAALALEAVGAAAPLPAGAGAGAGGSGVLWPRAGDLGCGTGLAAAAFRAHIAVVHGVDLSPAMVAEATRRRRTDAGAGAPAPPLYDALDVGEVVQWLLAVAAAAAAAEGAADAPPLLPDGAAAAPFAATRDPGRYDLLVAADVLVYMGPLEPLFVASAAALRAGGHFVGSTEALPEPGVAAGGRGGGGGGGDGGFRLNPTGRCSHRFGYVTAAAAAAGLDLVVSRRQTIRQNAGADVVGDTFVLVKRA